MADHMAGTQGGEHELLLDISSLSAGYGTVQIVSNVSISVGAGQVVALVGPNGAGKSTVLRAITGNARIFAGAIRLAGADVTGSPLENLVRQGVGYIPQGDDTFAHMSVRDNLEMGGYLLPADQRREAMRKVISQWPQLESLQRRRASTLSGGQQKMVAVARAMMLRPRLLILDEPTAGLSEALTRVVIQDIGVGLAKSGTSVLLVEQKARLALEAADWAYVLVQGSIAMAASARDVLQDEQMAEVFLGGAARA